jgi:hypothetical protein
MPELSGALAERPTLSEPIDFTMAAVQAVAAAAEAAALVSSAVLAERLEETRREVRSVLARLAGAHVA